MTIRGWGVKVAFTEVGGNETERELLFFGSETEERCEGGEEKRRREQDESMKQKKKKQPRSPVRLVLCLCLFLVELLFLVLKVQVHNNN